jgi:hypothetical protein
MGTFVGRRAHHHRSPLRIAVLVVAALQLLVAGPAMAADPPADVVLDGSLTVRFVAEGDGSPLAGADVIVEASRPAVDPVAFQTLSGTTDADGLAAFSGVARAADGADPVTLAVSATLTRANDCGGSETFDAATTVEGGPTLTVELSASGSSSCVAFPLLGTVVDAEGEPFAVADAAATITYPGAEPETVAVDIADDGSFAILLHGWAGEGSTEVALLVLGEPRQVPGDDGCMDVVADVADVSWTIDVPQAPDPTLVIASPTVVGSVCDGGTGTPAPAPTLPPTDTLAAADSGSATARPAIGGLLVVAVLLGLAVVGSRRLSRRGN